MNSPAAAAAANSALARRLYRTLGAARTGIFLPIAVGIASAAGTVIRQRPLTSPQEMQSAYSPAVLQFLDATGLTDVYHAWWYMALLGLVAAGIVCASLQRWPAVWRFHAQPCRRPDAAFRVGLPLQRLIPLKDAAKAGAVVERVWRRHGLKPERIPQGGDVSWYAEKNRFALMAVFVVHASLLLIMAGALVDGTFGYKGYLTLVPGQTAAGWIELRDGRQRPLPFAVRCDETGQENYSGQYAALPKQWWSKLTVMENGRAVAAKQIEVNNPLVYRGVRFYQSSYGLSGVMRGARLAALLPPSIEHHQLFYLTLNQAALLNDGSQIKIVRFLPDAFAMDGGLFQRSKELNSAAMELAVTKDGKTSNVYLLRSGEGDPREVILVGPMMPRGNRRRVCPPASWLPWTWRLIPACR